MKNIVWLTAAIIALWVVGGAVFSIVGGVASLLLSCVGYVVVALVAGKVGNSIGRAQERKMLGRGL